MAGGLGAYPTLQNSLTSFRRLLHGNSKVSPLDRSGRKRIPTSNPLESVYVATNNHFSLSPASTAAYYPSIAAQKRSLAFSVEAAVKSHKKEALQFYLPS